MGDTVEKLQLIAEATGQKEVFDLGDAFEEAFDKAIASQQKFASVTASLAPAVKQAESDTYELADAYEVLGEEMTSVFTSAQQIGPGMKAAAQAATQTATTVDAATKSVDKHGDAAKAGGKATRDLGGGFLELSRAVEDAQYGLNGVINNVPNMVQRFGGTAGLAAAISLTAVAINTLLPKLKTLAESFAPEKPREYNDQVKELEKQIEALSKLDHPIAFDMHQLDEAQKKLDALKKGYAEWKASQENQNIYQAASGKAIGTALTESETGEAAVARKIRDRFEAEDVGNSQTIRTAQADQAKARAERDRIAQAASTATDPAQAAAMLPFLEAAEKKIHDAVERERIARENLAKGAEAEYGKLLDQAKKGHGQEQLDAQERLAKRLEEVGEQQLANEVRANNAILTRKYMLAEEEFKADKEQREREAKLAEDAAKKEAAEKKKAEDALIDELNRQGKQNEAEALRENAEMRREQEAARKARDRAQAEKDRESSKAFDASTKQSGILEDASDRIAGASAAGGIPDQFGRPRQMTPEQIDDEVRKYVEKWLHRQVGVDARGKPVFANAGMGEEETGLTATRIVADARQQLVARFPGGVPQRPQARAAGKPGIKPRGKPRVVAGPKPAPKPAPVAAKPKPAGPQHPPGWRGPGGNQAALGPVEATQQAMAATQQAMGETQQRLAKLEANAARLATNAGRLRQQATQRQPSALDVGSSTA